MTAPTITIGRLCDKLKFADGSSGAGDCRIHNVWMSQKSKDSAKIKIAVIWLQLEAARTGNTSCTKSGWIVPNKLKKLIKTLELFLLFG